VASTSPSPVPGFDPARPWHLAREVSLRDEPFGALAYHHGNRRLVFLKSSALVELVRRLGEFDSAAEAVASLVAPRERARYESALATLAAGGLLGAG
jgi:mycofactocin biosynthesis protein MftB